MAKLAKRFRLEIRGVYNSIRRFFKKRQFERQWRRGWYPEDQLAQLVALADQYVLLMGKDEKWAWRINPGDLDVEIVITVHNRIVEEILKFPGFLADKHPMTQQSFPTPHPIPEDWAILPFVVRKLYYDVGQAQFERISPINNRQFIERFGLRFWRWYSKTYPAVDNKTKIKDDPYGHPTIYYPLPLETPVRLFSSDGTIPMYIPTRSGEARFERFGYAAPETWVKLAYAPEINTIFVQDERTGRK